MEKPLLIQGALPSIFSPNWHSCVAIKQENYSVFNAVATFSFPDDRKGKEHLKKGPIIESGETRFLVAVFYVYPKQQR